MFLFSPQGNGNATSLSGGHQDTVFYPAFRLGRTGSSPIHCSGKCFQWKQSETIQYIYSGEISIREQSLYMISCEIFLGNSTSFCNSFNSFLTLFIAAQLHILTLLEHIKEQQMQLAVAINNLAIRTRAETSVAEMPHDISLPLDTLSEVDGFEEWLKDSRNSHAKQNMVCITLAQASQHTTDTSCDVRNLC